MINKNQILEEVEKTLKSFDNDILLVENPFLLTRINAERKNRLLKPKKKLFSILSFTKVLIILVFLINLITVIYYYEWNSKQVIHQKLVSELKEDFQIDQSQNNF
jgi:hypothetical protein